MKHHADHHYGHQNSRDVLSGSHNVTYVHGLCLYLKSADIDYRNNGKVHKNGEERSYEGYELHDAQICISVIAVCLIEARDLVILSRVRFDNADARYVFTDDCIYFI